MGNAIQRDRIESQKTRMKATSTNQKNFEKTLKIKEQLIYWFEFVLVILAVILSLKGGIVNDVAMISVAISINLLYLGNQNFELTLYKNRVMYLKIDKLFTPLLNDECDITDIEEEYQHILQEGINVPDFIYVLHKLKEEKKSVCDKCCKEKSNASKNDSNCSYVCKELIFIGILIIYYKFKQLIFCTYEILISLCVLWVAFHIETIFQ